MSHDSKVVLFLDNIQYSLQFFMFHSANVPILHLISNKSVKLSGQKSVQKTKPVSDANFLFLNNICCTSFFQEETLFSSFIFVRVRSEYL